MSANARECADVYLRFYSTFKLREAVERQCVLLEKQKLECFENRKQSDQDPAISWDTDDPDLSLCFEKTVLTWTPCLVLWLTTPIEILLIQNSKCRDIPWRGINLLKLVGNLTLIGVSAVSLVWSVFKSKEENIYPVDVWTPAIQTATFLLTTVMLLGNRVRGRHTSGVLFIFFLLLAIGGAFQFRTELRLRDRGITEESSVKFILYMVYYPVVVLMLILNLFPDPPPRKADYPKSKKLCPEVQASYASRVVFRWFDCLIWKGFKNPLTLADLWDLRFQDTAGQIIPKFEKYWFRPPPAIPETFTASNGKSSSYGNGTLTNSRIRTKKPITIMGPTIKVLWLPIVTAGIVEFVADMLAFVNPQLLNVMIKFVTGKEFMWRGILYAVGMLVSAQLQTIFFHQSLMMMYVVGLNWRTALMSAVYRKALRISNSARKTSTVGEVVNLMAVDAQRCADFAPFTHDLWKSPIRIAVALYFLWQILGPSTLAGLAVMIIIVPVNSFIANKVKFLQIKQMKYKDERVKLMNEVLSGIKVLKLYAWEPSFKEYISKIREKELKLMRRAALLNASTSIVSGCSSFLVSLATFGVYVLVDERNVLTVEIAFVATSLFNVMCAAISFLPMMIQVLVQSIVSVKRIANFLNAEELDFNSVSHDESKIEPLIIESGTFSWGTETSDQPILRNINLRINKGSLVAVVGAVGAGKSSLISAFLGEMDKISGYVNIKGSIAYVPQQAWIQNATVKDNILFGSSQDAKKYFKTIEACSLKQDLDMLPGGDNTEIGEKGINLSGGQKQRMSLARAVYNDADTYLLDDPLSAVDSHVAKHIFENVIGPKGVLGKKTRVMVTHGVTFLPQVDLIVVMKNGEIIETGTFKELLNNKGESSNFLVQHITESEEDLQVEGLLEELIEEQPTLKVQIQRQLSKSGSVKSSSSNPSHRKASSASEENIQILTSQIDKLIQAEKTETGSVKMSVYMHYLKSAGLILSLATLAFQLLSQTMGIASNIWLSNWSSDTTAAVDGVQDKDKRNFYLEIYTALGFSQMAAVIAGAYALAFGTVLASRFLHSCMLANILHCPMSFFDTTPTGRLVNRFGKDVDVIDNTLPFTFSAALTAFGNVIGTIVVITYSTPLFATVIVPIGLLYYGIQKVYITTSRQLKRIESMSRSPVYSHFSETVSGATSIRAYKVENRFINISEDRVDANQVCLYPSLVANRWLGIRLETVGNIIIFFAALFAVLGRDTLEAGLVGLSLSYAFQITAKLNFAVRMSSEIETNIVSVERIKEYSEVPTEAAWVVEPRPDAQWPSQGTVQFQDYQVRYREGLDLVLRGASFVVNGGEKIGVVGRTGAGKSSLTLCLFRILEAAGGKIFIDGLDIAKIGLGDLRSKLTIIPQDPVLFSGSLRMNLDPFEIYSDSDIWRALQHAHLSDFARGLAAGLNHTVSEGGDNLSVGQRQLICLARALLRKTKVLILDEATAAIDLETDDLIQQTIRREFKDCTVLTIAHRLNTIMDSDRVIVLDKGTIKEFDSPERLLSSSSTVFYGMAKDAGLV